MHKGQVYYSPNFQAIDDIKAKMSSLDLGGCNTLALCIFTLRFLVHLPLDFDTFALRFLYIYP